MLLKSGKGFPWVSLLIGLNLFIFGIFIGNDWRVYLTELLRHYPFYLKGLFSLVCLIVVWSAGKRTFHIRDNTLLKFSWIFIFLGDLLFITPEVSAFNPSWLFSVTILCFIVFHIMAIVRCSRGFKDIKPGKRYILIRYVSALVLFGSITAVLMAVSGPAFEKGMLIPIAIYSYLLATSAWLGVNTLTLKSFPVVNAWLIAAGMLLFFMGDVLEAVKLGTEGTIYFDLAKKAIWLLYGPALLLISLSTFRFEGKKSWMLHWQWDNKTATGV